MINSDPPLLNTPDPIDEIVALARQAGKIALRYFQKVNPVFKQDKTFVTKVDLEIEHFLVHKIKAVYPSHNIIGEEGIQNTNDSLSPHTWAIDPIDGTTAFVQGLPGWGVSIGLLHQGHPVFGLFYMPLLNDLTYTTHQGQVYCDGRLLRHSVRQDWGERSFLAINATDHYYFQIKTLHTRALGSIGANLVYTARGTAAATFIPKAHLWDLVAGAAILIRAGGELRYLSGRLIDYLELLDGRLVPEPIIAAHPDLQATLRKQIGS